MREAYEERGFVVASGLFSPEETARLRDHYMGLRAEGAKPGDFDGVDLQSDDPLKAYPRMIHMHRWDALSREWLCEPRLAHAMAELTDAEPFAVQTMLYFKPPGARGQALHQDQAYLRASPGVCLAAWLALDDCDEENGCLQVVPGSHRLPLLCTQQADTSLSFTDDTVPVPEGMVPVPVRMRAGDVLFFHGLVIHGSYPNTSADRFRCALIGHYITGDASTVAPFYHPALRMDGSEIVLDESPSGGPCGVLVANGEGQSIEMVEPGEKTGPEHE